MPALRQEHDPEKWVPVFPRDKREAFARRSCSNKKIERDDDSKKSHPAPGGITGQSIDTAVNKSGAPDNFGRCQLVRLMISFGISLARRNKEAPAGHADASFAVSRSGGTGQPGPAPWVA